MSKQKNNGQLSLENYDEKTGEIKAGLNKSKFRTMWCNPYESKPQDLSNEFEDTFIEIAPFTRDEKGNWLNDSSVPKLVPNGKVNVQERIQSFADDVDIYKILERFAYSGDMSLINQRPVMPNDVDVSNLPNNLNDFNDVFNDMKDSLGSLHPDLAKMVLDDKTSFADIEAKAKSIYADRLTQYKKSNDFKKEKEKEIEKKESEK